MSESELIAVLESEAGPKEKADACRELAVVGTKEAVPALAALLGDEKLSHMARYGLETIPDPAVDDALRGALGKLEGRPLVGAIASIGVRRDAKAAAPLAKLLRHSDADVAGAAARALGRIATPEAVEAVKEALEKAPEELRPAVADGCLGAAEALLAHDKRPEAAALYQLVSQADLPKHFRVAAAHGALSARQPAANP
ncbi:MAG TPA: HEAT repeat domain-containing protein [Thermoguttaceae bacterium]|nr:HEAT repeat domain-containing protein [Thermoguttaceae bacterium]